MIQESAFSGNEEARYWHERTGRSGDDYKREFLDPLCFDLVGDLMGMEALELGCGNGYRKRQVMMSGAASLVAVDASEPLLLIARSLCRHPRVSWIRHDLRAALPFESERFDVTLSVIVFNFLEDIRLPVSEVFRVLWPYGGQFVLAVVHPRWYGAVNDNRAKLGLGRPKTEGSKGEQYRGPVTVFLGIDGPHRREPPLSVIHYQRPTEEYVQILKSAGFRIRRILEPQPPEEFFEAHPRFREDGDCPRVLVFDCERNDPVDRSHLAKLNAQAEERAQPFLRAVWESLEKRGAESLGRSSSL